MSYFIEIQDLTKKYGTTTVVNQLNLSIEKGSLFSFLGPNGAGKSTTINMISTALSVTTGSIKVAGLVVGKDNLTIRQKIGIVFQENVLDELLTVEENLIFWGTNYGLKKADVFNEIESLNSVIGLKDILKRPFGKLSGGQKRRAEIARAIIHSPELLILDEPTTGLDPKTRIQVWETITYLREKLNMTVFLTTHYMEEAAQSEKIAVINHGSIIALGTPNEIKSSYSSDTLIMYHQDLTNLLAVFQNKDVTYTQGADFLKIGVENSQVAFKLLNELTGYYQSFELHKGNLDDAFVNLIEGGR